MLRSVTTRDFEKLFMWVNDKEVRKNARYTEEKTLVEFKQWFNDALKNDKLFMFIYTKDNEDVGQAKLQIEKQEVIINYSIAKEYRGNGLGTLLIKEVESFIHENENIFSSADKLTAYIRATNKASCRVFEKLGYDKAFENEDYLKVQKDI